MRQAREPLPVAESRSVFERRSAEPVAVACSPFCRAMAPSRGLARGPLDGKRSSAASFAARNHRVRDDEHFEVAVADVPIRGAPTTTDDDAQAPSLLASRRPARTDEARADRSELQGDRCCRPLTGACRVHAIKIRFEAYRRLARTSCDTSTIGRCCGTIRVPAQRRTVRSRWIRHRRLVQVSYSSGANGSCHQGGPRDVRHRSGAEVPTDPVWPGLPCERTPHAAMAV